MEHRGTSRGLVARDLERAPLLEVKHQFRIISAPRLS